MKAVSVLLCLALANGISASIFKQQERQVDNLDVTQQEYIDQYQQQHRNQPSNNEKLRNQRGEEHRYQQRTHHREQQQYLQREQESQEHKSHAHKSQEHQSQEHNSQEHKSQEHKSQQHKWQQPQEYINEEQYSQPQQYQQYQKPAYQRVQYQSAQQSQEQDKQYEQPRHSQYKHKTHRRSDSSSSESSQGSQESYDRRHSYDNEQANTYNQQWVSPLYASAVNEEGKMVPVYGDAIVWNGIQMAVGPNAPVQNKDDIEKIFGEAQKAMKHISEEDKIKFHQTYDLVKQQNNEDAELNATQLAKKYQYPVEEHTIKTDDGYKLTLFRITPKKHIRDVEKRPVVFLMHGILGSADDWLLMGPGKSLAFLLSDAGYDVWLGNARGNKYSRRHVSKHPALSDFWQYSTDEIALHDLPAMIDYALQTTQQEKLYYIGHAQGTTAFFALTATRPEYNDKIVMMYALSPMAYMTNVRSPLFRMIAPTSKFSERLQQQFGNGAFTPKKELINTIGGAMLENEIGCDKVASHVNFVMAGVNVDGLESEIIPVVMRHLPAGTSTKVIKHYGQGVASQDFRRYDYGAKINQKVYGMEQPPKYEMEKVLAPVTLYYSEEDWLAHPKDVARLEKELPNVRETNKVPDEHFSHMDFQFSTKAPEMVYRRIIESMANDQ